MASDQIIRYLEEDQFRYYFLNLKGVNLLNEAHSVVVNQSSGHATLVNWQRWQFLKECDFRDELLPLLTTLLERWPSYVQHELLFQRISDEDPLHIVQQIEDARDDGTLDQVLAPLTSRLAGCRELLHLFQIDIVPVGDLGYKLSRYEEGVQA